MKGKYLHFYHFSVLEWWPTSPGWKVQEFLQTGVLVLRNKTSLDVGYMMINAEVTMIGQGRVRIDNIRRVS